MLFIEYRAKPLDWNRKIFSHIHKYITQVYIIGSSDIQIRHTKQSNYRQASNHRVQTNGRHWERSGQFKSWLSSWATVASQKIYIHFPTNELISFFFFLVSHYIAPANLELGI